MMKRPNLSNNPFAKGPRNVVIIAAVFVISLLVLTKLTDYTREVKEINYSTFLQAVERDQVRSAHIAGQEVSGRFKDGSRYETVVPATSEYIDILRAHEVEFGFDTPSSQVGHWYFFMFMLFGLLLFAMYYFFKQSRGSNNGPGGIFSIGKSRAKVTLPATIQEDFDSVAGAKDAKEELREIVEYLKNPEKFRRLGAKITRGILLVGEPGNGKTLLAKAVAGEANCPFFSITGSDFIEVFVGVGAARVRDLFTQARKQGPSIVFIDEIDAIGRQRGTGVGGGHDEREQTLNQLLTEMDGFDKHDAPVIVMAATNMPEVLDKALLRPGRFDRTVTVPYPDEAARVEILEIHGGNFALAENIDFTQIAAATSGFSGADLANLMNKAALAATKKNREVISQEDLEQAHKALLEANDLSQERKSPMAAGANRNKMFMPAQVKTKFTDVAGADEAKEELVDVVNFLKNPQHYKRLGAKLPRGVLLVGQPGNGKTLLARAVAGEANCPFFNVSGSDFIEQYVGVGASRVRDLFAQARKHKPSIIFIDEIDAIGIKRRDDGGGSQEYNQTLNQLLTEMDGFSTSDSPVVVIAATNRPDVLDTALMRPGRFDKRVEIPFPNIESREKILRVHAKAIKIDDTVDIARLARATSGFSGADLANLVNEAALLASKDPERTVVNIGDFDEARDKIIMGKPMHSKMMNDYEKEVTAYHEAGHALMRLILKDDTDPLYKVTIMPRGFSLGSTHSMPLEDSYMQSREQMIATIKVCLGGRAAELIQYNKMMTGASNDFEKATQIAQNMVTRYGMSDDLPPIVYPQGRSDYRYSEKTAQKIDAAIEAILEKAHTETMQALTERKADLEKLAQALLEKETLDVNEVHELFGLPPVKIEQAAEGASA